MAFRFWTSNIRGVLIRRKRGSGKRCTVASLSYITYQGLTNHPADNLEIVCVFLPGMLLEWSYPAVFMASQRWLDVEIFLREVVSQCLDFLFVLFGEEKKKYVQEVEKSFSRGRKWMESSPASPLNDFGEVGSSASTPVIKVKESE